MDMESQRNASKIVSKSVEKSRKSSFGAVLDHFGDPLGAKMAQDASWIASGLNLESSWGSSCRQDGSSWAKMTPRWRYVGQLGPQDGQLRSSLGGILAYFSNLERDLSKNSRSVKTTNTTTLLVVFRGSGARLEAALGAILDDVGSKMVSFGLS